ncbi:hypothetical protein [Capnocytophaga sp. oral taxon 902]|nr:hypothetical protein [Capnocytophaga sp. oral taxon 902]
MKPYRELYCYLHRSYTEPTVGLQWVYSGSTVALQWLYTER